MTTTLALIREDMARIMRGLVPASIASRRYQQSLESGDVPFPAWAEGEPGNCFRRFAIADTFDEEPPEVINSRSWEETVLSVVVSYPNRSGLYGQNQRDMRDVIREDRDQLKDELAEAGHHNYTEPCSITLDGTEVTRGDAVTFLSLDIRVRYWRAVN